MALEGSAGLAWGVSFGVLSSETGLRLRVVALLDDGDAEERRVELSVAAAADAKQMVIGPEALEWDMVLLADYPSRQKFLEMATDAD